MPNEVPASPPAPEENMPNEVPAPVLKWTQGATEGTCEVTNACGLHDALRAGGAVLSDELEVIVRKGKFAKTSLLALLCQPEKASPRAPLLDATCWIELAVPVDLPAVCMHITKGEVTDTMSVVKPVTAETVANALICKGHITKEDSDQNSVELVFGSVSIELKAQRLNLLNTICSEPGTGNVTVSAQLQYGCGTLPAWFGRTSSTVAAHFQHGWGAVGVWLQCGWGVVAVQLGHGCNTVFSLLRPGCKCSCIST